MKDLPDNKVHCDQGFVSSGVLDTKQTKHYNYYKYEESTSFYATVNAVRYKHNPYVVIQKETSWNSNNLIFGSTTYYE